MDCDVKKQVLVVGAGNFGTSLAIHLDRMGHPVTLWARDPQVVDAIEHSHRNPKHLSGYPLSARIRSSGRTDQQFVQQFSTVVLAIPTQSLRQVLQRFEWRSLDQMLMVCVAKGIEIETEKLPLAIIEDVCGSQAGQDSVVLSGPSFAIEIVEGLPTAVSAASRNQEKALMAQSLFHSPLFRVYTGNDPVGLEVAGALKNVIAIASGACQGFGYQSNSRAALITRGLAEMTRVGCLLGANPLTFNGLGGVGDLFLTCTSEKSRNYTVGYKLGLGEKLDDIISHMGSVAEGVATAQSAHTLASRLHASHPIVTSVFQVLYEKMPVEQAIHDLINRDPKKELDF